MSRKPIKLKSPPIVEAVVDIDCDMPRDFNPPDVVTKASHLLHDSYPKNRRRVVFETELHAKGDEVPAVTTREAQPVLQFLKDDEKQLVQIRPQGYSFNRLAPYGSFDEYLPEIERTWRLFVDLVSPVQVRLIRLRYINRFLLPMRNTKVDLAEYFTLPPRWPEGDRFMLAAFFDRRSLRDAVTNEVVNIVTTFQPDDGKKLPVILDIEAIHEGAVDCVDWPEINHRIESARTLKNDVFAQSLTKKCLRLFR